MARKSVKLNAGTYFRLLALKGEGESFSDLIDRLTGRSALLEIEGILSPEQGNRLKATRRALAKRFREGIDARQLR